MSKYSTLRHRLPRQIYTTHHTEDITSFLYRDGKTTAVHGLLVCPECGSVLSKMWTKEPWTCGGCGTVWALLELVQAVEGEERLVRISIRDLK